MASVGAEFEDQINEWMKAFEALPADRKENLKKWFATQKIIVENSGLSVEEWFGFIRWAMDNPLDYSFILKFPDSGEVATEGGDTARRSDETKDARRLVGGDAVKVPLEDGPGIKDKATSDRGIERELFNEFMKNRLGGGRK